MTLVDHVRDRLPIRLAFVEGSILQFTDAKSAALFPSPRSWAVKTLRRECASPTGWIGDVAGEFSLTLRHHATNRTRAEKPREHFPVRANPRARSAWRGSMLCGARIADKETFLGHGSAALDSGDGMVLKYARVLTGLVLTGMIHDGHETGWPWRIGCAEAACLCR